MINFLGHQIFDLTTPVRIQVAMPTEI